ncbi:MAG: hypothetical protein RQ899_04205 [Pseudomonadales bacterium]|nr:hypothetical protein [Pseudomonadales bacterium]
MENNEAQGENRGQNSSNSTRSAVEKQAFEDDIGQILHRLNQPLTAINNYAQAGCQLIERGEVDPARLQDLFIKIFAQSLRSFEISQELGISVLRKPNGQEN